MAAELRLHFQVYPLESGEPHNTLATRRERAVFYAQFGAGLVDAYQAVLSIEPRTTGAAVTAIPVVSVENR